jgi:EAL domain-containing protein (putative c-di-GMP-specific phosphodiesterase class I)
MGPTQSPAGRAQFGPAGGLMEKPVRMSKAPVATSNAVWFLVGPFDSAETVRHQPIYTFPFLIGRRQDLPLSLSCKTISTVHAEISEGSPALMIRDLGSTNGTYVNGSRVKEPVVLNEDDLVQFANLPFRIRMHKTEESSHTIRESACDQALALVLFDKLMTEHAVTPFLQPIVRLNDRATLAYEVLARSRLFGLETPKDMFGVAQQLNLEVELSTMLRWEGVQVTRAMEPPPHLFLNTHPLELADQKLGDSLERLRENWPDQGMTLEIHESAVTQATRLTDLRSLLKRLDIKLAFDDFGVGQSRLNDLAEIAPDYVKFDMSLIRGIDSATPQRQQVLAALVQMVRNLGITSLAEGVETDAEDQACRQMGFDLAQGFLFGRPAPPLNFSAGHKGPKAL